MAVGKLYNKFSHQFVYGFKHSGRKHRSLQKLNEFSANIANRLGVGLDASLRGFKYVLHFLWTGPEAAFSKISYIHPDLGKERISSFIGCFFKLG